MADAQAEVAVLGLRMQLTFFGMIIQTSTTQHLSPFDLCFCMFFGHLSCAGYSLVHKDIHKGVKHNPSMDSHAQEAKLHGKVEPLADASTVPGPCPLVPPLATWRSLLQTVGLTQSPWYLTLSLWLGAPGWVAAGYNQVWSKGFVMFHNSSKQQTGQVSLGITRLLNKTHGTYLLGKAHSDLDDTYINRYQMQLTNSICFFSRGENINHKVKIRGLQT